MSDQPATTSSDDTLDELRAQLHRLTSAFDENTRRHQAAIARVDELLGVIARARALASQWAVLRAYRGAATELRAVLDEPGPAATQASELEKTARVFAALHRSAEQDVTRVIALYEQWVKAGPPPLGTSMSRWWDARLVELHDAILPPAHEEGPSVRECLPGDTREQLPAHLLELIDPEPYESTACQTARLLDDAIRRHPGQAAELTEWRDRLYARCRINNKFTGQLCTDSHHRHAPHTEAGT